MFLRNANTYIIIVNCINKCSSRVANMCNIKKEKLYFISAQRKTSMCFIVLVLLSDLCSRLRTGDHTQQGGFAYIRGELHRLRPPPSTPLQHLMPTLYINKSAGYPVYYCPTSGGIKLHSVIINVIKHIYVLLSQKCSYHV